MVKNVKRICVAICFGSSNNLTIPFTSTIISNGCQIIDWDHRNETIIRLKKYHFCFMKLHGFHGNL